MSFLTPVKVFGRVRVARGHQWSLQQCLCVPTTSWYPHHSTCIHRMTKYHCHLPKILRENAPFEAKNLLRLTKRLKCSKNELIYLYNGLQWRIQDFPVDANVKRRVPTYWQNFNKNYMKIKRIGQMGDA